MDAAEDESQRRELRLRVGGCEEPVPDHVAEVHAPGIQRTSQGPQKSARVLLISPVLLTSPVLLPACVAYGEGIGELCGSKHLREHGRCPSRRTARGYVQVDAPPFHHGQTQREGVVARARYSVFPAVRSGLLRESREKSRVRGAVVSHPQHPRADPSERRTRQSPEGSCRRSIVALRGVCRWERVRVHEAARRVDAPTLVGVIVWPNAVVLSFGGHPEHVSHVPTQLTAPECDVGTALTLGGTAPARPRAPHRAPPLPGALLDIHGERPLLSASFRNGAAPLPDSRRPPPRTAHRRRDDARSLVWPARARQGQRHMRGGSEKRFPSFLWPELLRNGIEGSIANQTPIS
jgi:hypothetical protein